MNEQELRALLDAEVHNAAGYLNGDLSARRRKAMDYYLGEPFGNEVEGQSQVVSTDVADTIEWILPALLKIFSSGDETVRFDPQGPEDEEAAKQATEYVNWIFNRDNPGFLILYSLFKDALLQKNGVAKVWWEDRTDYEEDRVVDLPDDAWSLKAMERADWEITEHEERPADGFADDPFAPRLHSALFRKEISKGTVKIVNVPPEEFLISRRARSIGDAAYVGHRVRRTASELIEDGYDRAVVDGLPEDDWDVTEETQARDRNVDEFGFEPSSTANQAMRKVWVYESYVKVDWDDDGIAEMRKVTHAGSSNTILKRKGKADNVPWEGPRPFVSVTPVIMPHRFFGLSVADLVMDLQLIKSTVLRQILTNLYLVNNGRHVISDQVNLDDLLTSRPGGVVRLAPGARPQEGHVLPLTTPLVAAQAFPMLEYLDSVRENRTGVTRYNQGIDANSLNKTASGITQIMSAAQQRIELIARVFAETGVKDLFALVMHLVRTYQDRERVIRLRNQWVPIDPGRWKGDFDLSINVGLGTGNRDQMLGHLMTIATMQEKIIAFQGGADGPLVKLEHVHNTLEAIASNMGFRSADKFVADPAQEQAQPQPPRPDPMMAKAQAEMQVEQAKAEAEMRLAETKARHAMEMDRMKVEADIALDRAKAMADAEIAAMRATRQAEMGMAQVGMTGNMGRMS